MGQVCIWPEVSLLSCLPPIVPKGCLSQGILSSASGSPQPPGAPVCTIHDRKHGGPRKEHPFQSSSFTGQFLNGSHSCGFPWHTPAASARLCCYLLHLREQGIKLGRGKQQGACLVSLVPFCLISTTGFYPPNATD